MVKRILLFIVQLLLLAYLVIAVTAFNRKPDNMVCADFDLIIKDSVHAGFITKKEVESILKNKDLYPVGKPLISIESRAIENELDNHSLIDKAECYKTPSGKLCIEVSQRIPILRVINANGDNYFIDNKGKEMPSNAKCIAHTAVATGWVDKAFAQDELYKLGLFLQNNKFWKAQIEQINVLQNKRIELVPRVGEHIIYIGKIHNFENKLQRVKLFYEKALNKVGWNKYSYINVEFSNQIICTKRNE